jgi:hypothetical protein
MMDKLTAKLGPLPVWVWGLFIGGLLVAWQWARSRNSGTVTETEDSGSTSAAVPSFPSSGTGNSQGTNTVVTGEDYEATPTERTNGQWLMLAVKAAVQKGVSTLSAQSALEKYLTGQHLTAGEKGIVDTALADTNVGLPPQGVGGTPTWDAEAGPVRYGRINGTSEVYRVEKDGSLTPYSMATWSTFRLTPAGMAVKFQDFHGAEATWATNAKKNKRI